MQKNSVSLDAGVQAERSWQYLWNQLTSELVLCCFKSWIKLTGKLTAFVEPQDREKEHQNMKSYFI